MTSKFEPGDLVVWICDDNFNKPIFGFVIEEPEDPEISQLNPDSDDFNSLKVWGLWEDTSFKVPEYLRLDSGLTILTRAEWDLVASTKGLTHYELPTREAAKPD